MKGLLKKEIIMLWKNFRIYMVMCLFFLIFGTWSENNFFMLFYPAMLCGMIPVSLISFDEKTGWDQYSLCFPLSRKQLVGSKYLVSLLCTAAICGLYGLVWAVKILVTREFGDAVSMLSVYLPMLLTIALLPPTGLLPCVYKLGSQKGAYAYYAVIAFIGAVVVVALNIGGSARVLNTLNVLNTPTFFYAFPLISAILFALSWPLSARIYEKKSF